MEAIVMWVTILSGPLDGATYGIIYYSEQACLDAKTPVSDSLDYDHTLVCREVP